MVCAEEGDGQISTVDDRSAADVPSPRRLRHLPVAFVAGKLRRRLWSTRRAVAVVREFQAGQVLPLADLHVELIPPDSFDALPRLVEQAVGVEYLYLRPIERTRRARAGTLAVARTALGDLVAFHFIHEAGDHGALGLVAPGMYPRLPADEVLTEAVYCLPAYRGRAFAPSLLQATGVLLAGRGKTRAWAYLDTTNTAALRMFHRAGYVPSGEERVDRYRCGRFSTVFRPLTPPTEAEWQEAVAGARSKLR